MAVIGKIRERSWILVGFIALALLIFLVQAAFDSNTSFNFGGSKDSVGQINGENISAREFSEEVVSYEEGLKLLNPQMPVDDKLRGQIQDEVWYNKAMQVLIGGSLGKAGIDVTVTEMGDLMWGPNPHPLAQRLLYQFGAVDQQTGRVDVNKARQIMTNIDQYDPDGKNKLRQTIAQMESLIREETIKSKYTALVAKSFYMPAFMAKEVVNGSRMATVSMVNVPFNALPDDKYKVSDEEIAQYIKDHAAKFQMEATRTLDVVAFDIVPSAEDTANAVKKINQLHDDFLAAANDSAFIARNSAQGANLAFLSKDEIERSGRNADTLFSLPAGTTTKVYTEGNFYLFTKIIARTTAPDSVRAAHILLSTGSGSEADKAAANNLADSLIATMRAGKANFGDIAFQNSQDEGSKKKGGDLGYFGRNNMVKEFNDLVFFGNMAPGEMRKVESAYGLHIVLMLDARKPTTLTKFADFVVELAPGKETEKAIYAQAVAFKETNNTPDKFTKAIKTRNAFRNIIVNTNSVEVMNLGPARKLVQWAYQQEETGGIEFFDLNDKFVVAKLNKITEKGLAKPDDVREEVTLLVRNEKKGKDLADKLAKASAGSTDLDAIAAKVPDAAVLNDVQLRYAQGFVMGLGNEPKLTGAAFGTAIGKLSKPVIGNSGVYLVKPASVDAQAPEADGDINQFKVQMSYAAIAQLNFQVILESILKKAQVEDKRFTYF